VEGDRIRIVFEADPAPNFDPNWRLLDATGNFAVSCGNYTSGSAYCDPLPASGNPYRLEVWDGSTDTGGTYHIHLQTLTAATACEAIPLPCDSTVTGVLEDGQDVDLYAFDVAEGEQIRILFEADPAPNFDPNWRLMDATGEFAASCGNYTSLSAYCGPLPASGNPYRLEVWDGSTDTGGTYHVHLQRLTAATACEAIPLPCDSTVTGTLEDGQDSDLYAFEVVEGDQIEILFRSDAASGFEPRWRLLDATGSPATSCGSPAEGVAFNCGPMPESGNPYRVEVWDGGTDVAGTYQLHLQALTAASACEAIVFPCSVVTDPTLWSIDGALDSDLHLFTVGDSATVEITVQSAGTQPDFSPRWRLLDSTGSELSGFSGPGVFVRGPLLESDNPHRVEVVDSDRNLAGSGPYYILIRYCGAPVPSDLAPEIPKDFALHQNQPNPFNPSTVIYFDLPRSSDVKLEVFNLLGMQVAVLVDGRKPAGRHIVHWNASTLASGVYVYKLTASDFEASRKLILLK
jgi:hypothetical protein